MTKAELIRKIAKQSGVPDAEAKLFFEIFLRKTAGVTEQGDALFVPDYGYFLPKKGKMNASNFEGENLDVFLDLIVYKPSKEEKQDNLIFNVPESSSNGNEAVDFHFSLSIGKPVIPLQGVKDVDFFLPPSGHELRRLIESKVEKLIEESEVIKNFKSGNDVILINKDEFDQSQLEMNYNSSNKNKEEKLEIESDIDIEDSIDFNEVNWNSSRDLSKEIEEESLLDVGKDYDSVFEEETSGLSWNFGNLPNETDLQDEGTEEQETELRDEEINNEENSPVIEDNSNLENGNNNEDINDVNNKTEIEQNVTADVEEIIHENDLDENQSKLNLDEAVELETKLSYEDKLHKERKSYTWIFILIALILLAAAYFFITSMYKNQNSSNNSPSRKIIEKKSEDTKVENAANNGIENNNDKSVTEDLTNFPKQNIEKITDYIFKYGKIYVVQVSSWKTKDKAVNQVELYKSTGKNAFLEDITIKGSLWYRVRVGNFNSLTEAKQFLNKN